jgi:hypothetical protein
VSVRVMTVVWGWSLPATEKLVALKLADCADDKGRNAWPAVATIASECGLSPRGVHNVLRRLRERGCIDVDKAVAGRSVVYRVCLEARIVAPGSADDDSGGVHVVQGGCAPGADPTPEPGAEGVCTSFRGGVHVVQGGCAPGADDPSVIRQGSVTRTGARVSHPLDEPRQLAPWAVAAFDRLWELYPRGRQGPRVRALRAWHAVDPSQEVAELIIAHVRVRQRAGDWAEMPPRFIPLLASFLDERRWEDRYQAPEGVGRRGPPDGMLVMRSCPSCGAEQEGNVVAGEKVFGACAACAQGEVAR